MYRTTARGKQSEKSNARKHFFSFFLRAYFRSTYVFSLTNCACADALDSHSPSTDSVLRATQPATLHGRLQHLGVTRAARGTTRRAGRLGGGREAFEEEGKGTRERVREAPCWSPPRVAASAAYSGEGASREIERRYFCAHAPISDNNCRGNTRPRRDARARASPFSRGFFSRGRPSSDFRARGGDASSGASPTRVWRRHGIPALSTRGHLPGGSGDVIRSA